MRYLSRRGRAAKRVIHIIAFKAKEMMFKNIHIEKDKAVFYDHDGNKIKRSIYYDPLVGNYFIYEGKVYTFVMEGEFGWHRAK